MDTKISVLTDEFHDADFKKVLEYLSSQGEIDYVALRKIGERFVYDLKDEEIQDIKTIIQDHGMKVSSISGGLLKIPWWGPPEDEDELADGTLVSDYQMGIADKCIELANIFNAPFIRAFGFQDMSFFPELVDYIWESWITTIKKIVKKTKQHGKTIILENINGFIFSDLSSIKATFKEIPGSNLMILYDPSNYRSIKLGAQFTPELFSVIKDRTGAIHVRDAEITKDDPYETKWVMLGDGKIKWTEIVNAYKNNGYESFWTIEPHLGPENAWEKMKESIEQAIRLLER